MVGNPKRKCPMCHLTVTQCWGYRDEADKEEERRIHDNSTRRNNTGDHSDGSNRSDQENIREGNISGDGTQLGH